LHKAQNHIRDALVADRGVQQGMVDDAIGPVCVEIFLNEIGAFAIDSVDQFFGLGFAFAPGQQAPDFVFPGSVEKEAYRVLPVLEKLL
jgi:hypothetical protein